MKSRRRKLCSVRLLDAELRACAAARPSLLFLASFARWVRFFVYPLIHGRRDERIQGELLGYWSHNMKISEVQSKYTAEATLGRTTEGSENTEHDFIS